MSNKTNADRHTQLTEVAITTSKFRVVKNLFVRLFFRLTIGILVVWVQYINYQKMGRVEKLQNIYCYGFLFDIERKKSKKGIQNITSAFHWTIQGQL